MAKITVKLTPSRYTEDGADSWTAETRITVNGTLTRFGLGYVGPRGVCRREYQGPILAGPYAYAYGLAAVIDYHGGTGAERARNIDAGLEFDLNVGDFLEFNGEEFRIEFNGRDKHNLRLVHVPKSLTPAEELAAAWMARIAGDLYKELVRTGKPQAAYETVSARYLAEYGQIGADAVWSIASDCADEAGSTVTRIEV